MSDDTGRVASSLSAFQLAHQLMLRSPGNSSLRDYPARMQEQLDRNLAAWLTARRPDAGEQPSRATVRVRGADWHLTASCGPLADELRALRPAAIAHLGGPTPVSEIELTVDADGLTVRVLDDSIPM